MRELKKDTQHMRHMQPMLATNPLLQFQRHFNHALRDFYDLSDLRRLEEWDQFKLSPRVDVVEDKHCFKLEVEMPGLGEEDIQVFTDENTLTIIGEKTCSKKDEKKNFLCREIDYGRYERCISLPLTADVNKISATFKKGMLWIEIPKKFEANRKSRKVMIQKMQ